ncbi:MULTISPECIES: phosphopantetheine-binding protein [unclassified Corynebacterium]|uniref:phosphopantetheine-binding protein n=1 Tax=unclassified Corynebacterium TaxID=2624378 RepID=UPI0026571E16|nr:phosphopantetheine-binding protein [Corynebacterium sp.]
MADGADGKVDDRVEATMGRLLARVAELLNIEVSQIDTDEELMDQGLDSVRLVEIVTFLRREGFEADFADLAEDSSVDAWRELLTDQV